MIKTIVLVVVIGFGIAVWMRAANAADPPIVGSAAPDFSLPDQNGKVRSLSDFRGKWLALYFYPKDDTPGCTKEACTYRDDLDKISALGAQVVGISVDDTASHVAFVKKYNLTFPLLSDETGVVATHYGSLNDLFVIKVAKRNTFLIDPQGKVAKVYLSVQPEENSQQVIADLQQLIGNK